MAAGAVMAQVMRFQANEPEPEPYPEDIPPESG